MTRVVPDVLLLVGTHCPNCPSVMKNLTELLKLGEIARLEMVNLEQRPDVAAEHGVRSVPWIKINELELTGKYSLSELREWITKSTQGNAQVESISELLNTSRVDEVIDMITADHSVMDTVIEILAQPEARFNVRLGIGVVMESFESHKILQQQVGALGKLCQHESPAVRGDACHYLGLSHSKDAIAYLEARLDDEDGGVREIVADALEALNITETKND